MKDITFEEILAKKSAILQILKDNYIDKNNFKFFGVIVGQDFFPLVAQAHFLIIPGNYGSEKNWRALQNEISALFPECYFEFYTPGLLSSMIAMERLKKETVEQVIQQALSWEQVEELRIKKLSNLKVNKLTKDEKQLEPASIDSGQDKYAGHRSIIFNNQATKDKPIENEELNCLNYKAGNTYE